MITPVPGVSASFRPPVTRLTSPYHVEGLAHATQVYLSNQGNSGVEVSVDSIILEDGTLIGPDTADRLNEFNNKLNAEREILQGIENLSGEDLGEKLVFYGELEGAGRCVVLRHQTAKFLERVFEEEGDAEVIRITNLMRSVNHIAPIRRKNA